MGAGLWTPDAGSWTLDTVVDWFRTKSDPRKKTLRCHQRINQELFDFYKGLFSENLNVSKNEIMQFLNVVSIPQFTEDQSI